VLLLCLKIRRNFVMSKKFLIYSREEKEKDLCIFSKAWFKKISLEILGNSDLITIQESPGKIKIFVNARYDSSELGILFPFVPFNDF
jgi:hypothetical protein